MAVSPPKPIRPDGKKLDHDTTGNTSVNNEQSEEDPIAQLFLKLHSIINTHPYKTESVGYILDFGPSYTLIMHEIILKTRFGQRFSCLDPVYSHHLPSAVPLNISDLEGREKVLTS